ncbi:putative serine/threonine-protein kinase 10-like [Homarus americanus]|uniref:Putative serine/threonine-protein kinase 10-like n=1 Tax=Homarus americanus TaxID=6706 RepID=A0A8J5K5A6_HOMAM|nr:putative serine/threonine-protein kinase 10-like [Homarus americanus]
MDNVFRWWRQTQKAEKSILDERMEVDEKPKIESDTQEPKNKSNVDVVDTNQVSPVTTVALSTPDSSTVVSPQSQVTHMSGQATNEPEPPAVPKREELDTVVLSDQVVAADQVKAPDSSAKGGISLQFCLQMTLAHISVVAVDDLSEAASSSKDTPSSQKDSLVSSKTPPPAPVDQKTTTTRSPVQSEQDHQDCKESSANKPALVRELTIGSEVSVESGVSAGSTVSTPSHQTDYSQQSTPVANSPVTKILMALGRCSQTGEKQFQELAVKANFAKEQEKKFDLERQQLLRGYDTEIEALNRQQNSRAEQERELKAFHVLKTELKLLKQEVDLLPKVSLKRLGGDHRERIALLGGSSFSKNTSF